MPYGLCNHRCRCCSDRTSGRTSGRKGPIADADTAVQTHNFKEVLGPIGQIKLEHTEPSLRLDN